MATEWLVRLGRFMETAMPVTNEDRSRSARGGTRRANARDNSEYLYVRVDQQHNEQSENPGTGPGDDSEHDDAHHGGEYPSDHPVGRSMERDVEGTLRAREEGGNRYLPLAVWELFWSNLSLSEVSGSFGDLGTFIPLFVAMGRGDGSARSIHVAPALFWAGLSNVATGCYWDLPLPVQPMKTICAVALVGELDRVQVSTAGVWMGVLLLVLGATNAIELVNLLVPRSVVSGLQMGVGCSLALRGLDLVAPLSWWALDGRFPAVMSALLAMYLMNETNTTNRYCLMPVGIVLFGLCTLIAVLRILQSSVGFSWQLAPVLAWGLQGSGWNDWMTGLWEGALPQLPLSTLNTIISTCCLARSLYPQNANLPTRRHMAISVGLMNLLLCPLGAMPSCHGAGGLAGQYKFGARHGTSVVFLGTIKMLLALACGGSIMLFLDQIPSGVLGVMLFISGHSLAHTGWTMLTQESVAEKLPQESAVSLLTMMAIVGLKKTHYGTLVGLIAHLIYGDGFAVMRRMVESASASTKISFDSSRARERESLITEAFPTTNSQTRLD